MDTFGPIFVQIYGLTEAPQPDLILDKNDHQVQFDLDDREPFPAGYPAIGVSAKIVDDASPIVYGVPDNLAVFTKTGQWLTVSNQRGGGGFGRGGGGRGGNGGAARATGRGQPDDPDTPQGRPASMEEGQFAAPPRPQGTAWSPAPLTDDAFRNPLNIIPPDQRPRVALRYADQRDLFVSGLLDGGQDLAQRPVVVDSPVEKGHVVLFANNPIYRGETIGTYFMVYNTLLNWDNLNAGRKLDPR